MSLSFNSILRGALAGVIATVPMTVTMNLIRSNLSGSERQRDLPPEEILSASQRHAGPNFEITVDVPHYLYGGFSGAVYALSEGVFAKRFRLRSELSGPLFGLVVWAVSYLGWMPALTAINARASESRATHQSINRNLTMISSHLVWGFVMARLMGRSVAELTNDALIGMTGKSRGARFVQGLFA